MPPPASFGAPNAAADASPAAFTFRVPAAPPVVVDRPDPPAPKPVPDAAAAAREWNATLAQSPPPPVAAAPREPSAFDRTQRSAPEENASTPPVARRRPIGAAPVAGGVVLVIAVAGLVVVQPWNSDSPAPTATPIAVAPTPTPTPEPSATPEETPVVETTPTAPPAPTPTAKPVQTKVAAVRATPKPPATPAGKQPGAKFGARPSPNPADPKFIALDDGHRQMDVRRLSAAVAKYKELSETYPTFPDGHYWFAYASAMEGDAKSACTGFKRYVALAPKGYYLKSARQQSGLFCATTE